MRPLTIKIRPNLNGITSKAIKTGRNELKISKQPVKSLLTKVTSIEGCLEVPVH